VPNVATDRITSYLLPRRLRICALDVVKHFGTNVRRAREQRGWTQGDLAARCGIDNARVSRIELGRREPKLTTVIRLSRALDVPPNKLFEGLLSEEADFATP
jgi:transcriptional regulator with XRE-family HTH domain